MLHHDLALGVTLLVRTDFSDDAAWQATVEAARAESEEGFRATFAEVTDPALRDAAVPRLVELITHDQHPFVLVVDERTLRDPERPVLVVDLYDEPGRTFRVVPEWLWSVENNLSLANLDFSDFADNIDEDGVFRGF